MSVRADDRTAGRPDATDHGRAGHVDPIRAVHRRICQRRGRRTGGAASTPAPADWEPGGGLLIWLLLLTAPIGEAIQARHASAWWPITLVIVYGAGFAMIVYQFEHGVSARIRYPVVVAFVLAGLALTTVFNNTAVFVAVFTSMAVAISLPLIRPALFGLLAVTAGAMLVGLPGGVFAVIGLGFGTYIAGFVTFVMRRLFVSIAELQRARGELASAAVAQERLRFARDLHDLLGHSLSVIVVKAELIRRTADSRPASGCRGRGRHRNRRSPSARRGSRCRLRLPPGRPTHRGGTGRACAGGCRDRHQAADDRIGPRSGVRRDPWLGCPRRRYQRVAAQWCCPLPNRGLGSRRPGAIDDCRRRRRRRRCACRRHAGERPAGAIGAGRRSRRHSRSRTATRCLREPLRRCRIPASGEYSGRSGKCRGRLWSTSS